MPIVNFSGMGAGRRIVSGRAGAGRLRLRRCPIPALLAWLVCSGPAAAQDASAPLRGPIELRDEWLPAQSRLTLPAASPDVLAGGVTRLRLSFDWGNDFGWIQDVRGEQPNDRRFIVDGEHRTLALELRRGLGGGFEAGARLPVRWRGPGLLDGVIDAFHELTLRLGLPDNQRGSFLNNQFRVGGRDAAGQAVAWDAQPGTGFGNLELEARWAAAGRADGRRLALLGRLALPTSTGPLESGGIEGGLQVVAAAPLGGGLELYAGLGGTAFAERELAGLEYRNLRGMGFLVLEWRAGKTLSLLVELSGATRLVTNLADYPGIQSYLRIGARIDLPGRVDLEAGFSENLVDQQATTDFAAFVGLTRAF
jgi:hypothetical protein